MEKDRRQQGYDLMTAAFEVYNHIGHGFLESVYQECLERELSVRNIPFESQRELSVCYKSMPLKQTYRVDLVVYDCIITEIKAVRAIAPEHRAQLLNYLKASDLRVGYLLNYGTHDKLEWERLVN
jgi:GxxExxY protein